MVLCCAVLCCAVLCCAILWSDLSGEEGVEKKIRKGGGGFFVSLKEPGGKGGGRIEREFEIGILEIGNHGHGFILDS